MKPKVVMTTEFPKQTVAEAIQILSDRDEFEVIVQFIRDERERFFMDLRQATDSNEVMKITGSISTLSEIIELMSTAEQ